MAKTVFALNTASGKVGEIPAVYLELPGLKEYLVEVPAGTKSYEPSKFQPQTAKEYISSRKKSAPVVEKEPTEAKADKP